jgi:hypothetical protein
MNRGFGQPGERETTQHGVVNDITVPKLRLREIIIHDEIMIIFLMLLLPIGATLVGQWILPIFMVSVSLVLFRDALENCQTRKEARIKAFYIFMFCGLVFGLGAMIRNSVSERLQQGVDAILQWPPKIRLFLNRVAFLALPFFIPIFTRIPLLTNYFRITLLDPTWPSPRTAQDIEGIQSPDEYNDVEQEETPQVVYPITTTGRKKSHGKPSRWFRRDWFAPKKNDNGLAEFGKAILENRATFSEKGSKKTSANPKVGALYFGYTQAEYVKLRKIGINLGLVEKAGNGYELTNEGIEAMVKAIDQTLGNGAIPKGYENWI